MNKEYLAIIGLYKGTAWLDKITKSLENQTIPPSQILIWNQASNFNRLNYHKYHIIDCPNLGVYARFSAGLLYNYDRVLVLDDDTIPGKRWIENCYNTIDQVGDESIIGYRGIKLHPDTLYDIEAYEKGNDQIRCVSLIGHSFFVKRKHIIELFKTPELNQFNGEDSTLAASTQLAFGTKCYVPKQLLSEPDTWGSLMQHLGALPGRLSTSLGCETHFKQRQEVNRYWVNKGWII
jgi:hypothetical protein